VPKSVLEAIRMGIWDYEPNDSVHECHEATLAMPGTRKKLDELARRVEEGRPLWHPADSDDCEYGELD
jgi:hypothetical protein